MEIFIHTPFYNAMSEKAEERGMRVFVVGGGLPRMNGRVDFGHGLRKCECLCVKNSQFAFLWWGHAHG